LNAFTHDPQPSHGAWSAVDPDHRGVGFQVDDDLDKRLIMMRAVLVILFLLFSLAGDTAGVQPDGIGGGVGTDGISNAPSQIDLSQYTLTFAEDFDTLSISSMGQGTTWAWNKPDQQNFGQVGYSDVFSVAGGFLTIGLYNNAGTWHAGILASVQTLSGASPGAGFAQQYGYWEMRARFPGAPNGNAGGTWPAFWLLAQNHITSNLVIPDVEIDIVEQFGNFHPTKNNMTYHHWISPTPVEVAFSAIVGDMEASYNTYGLSIDPVWIKWFFNRIEIARLATPPEAKTPMYVLIDLACSGGPPCNDPNTLSPSNMLVDYVHVYSHN
jgi:hypothetical protein